MTSHPQEPARIHLAPRTIHTWNPTINVTQHLGLDPTHASVLPGVQHLLNPLGHPRHYDILNTDILEREALANQ